MVSELLSGVLQTHQAIILTSTVALFPKLLHLNRIFPGMSVIVALKNNEQNLYINDKKIIDP